jgi:hypothetical protein
LVVLAGKRLAKELSCEFEMEVVVGGFVPGALEVEERGEFRLFCSVGPLFPHALHVHGPSMERNAVRRCGKERREERERSE